MRPGTVLLATEKGGLPRALRLALVCFAVNGLPLRAKNRRRLTARSYVKGGELTALGRARVFAEVSHARHCRVRCAFCL
jgi:hypothetical protein